MLTGADLIQAHLQGADLRQAVLSGTYLTRADLEQANLHGADLRGAMLRGALLKETIFPNGMVVSGISTGSLVEQVPILSLKANRTVSPSFAQNTC